MVRGTLRNLATRPRIRVYHVRPRMAQGSNTETTAVATGNEPQRRGGVVIPGRSKSKPSELPCLHGAVAFPANTVVGPVLPRLAADLAES